MDDRTEIATALRGLTHETYYNEEIVDNICDAINIADPTNTFRTPEDIYNLLADLIDPTCRIYWVDTSYNTPDAGYEPDGYYTCSHCDCEFGDYTSEVWDTYQARYYEGEPPFEFCPHCGARIIIDEPRKDDCAN